MKITSNIISKSFLVLLFVSSCTPVTQEVIAIQVKMTDTPPHTVTSTPIPLPFPTATKLPVDNIFVIPTYVPILDVTPTPIATPGLDYSSMRLSDISDGELLHFINELQERSYQYSPPHSGWWPEGQFVVSQQSVALAMQEYLYRFPNSEDANRLRWQLAFIDSISYYSGLAGNEYNDKWIIKQLQNELDQGDVLPEDLEAVLDRYWFDVDYQQAVENLFGDEKSAWFYVIRPQVWDDEEDRTKSSDFFYRGGLFVVVQEVEQGRYQIHILETAWEFINGTGSLFEISDFNKNGVPEIALNLWVQGGTMCGGSFKIFEWQDSAFADLTRGEIQVGDCFDNYEYALVEGTPSIRLKKAFTKVPSVYTWNGRYYEFSKYEYSSLVEKWTAVTLDPNKGYADEAKVIEEILSSDGMEGLSTAQGDYLRLRLGIAYALSSNPTKAKATLQNLVDNPLDKSLKIYSELARDFLRYYTDNSSLYFACKKSREDLDSIRIGESESELFGISFDISSNFGVGRLRCFSKEVFQLLIDKIPSSTENVPDELQRNGMEMYYAKKQDVNLDGLSDEWLMIFDDGIFVVAPSDNGFDVIELGYVWYGEDTTGYSTADVRIEQWPGMHESILTVISDKELSMMSVDNDYRSTWLFSEYHVKDMLFSPQANTPHFQIVYTKPISDQDNYDIPWAGYRLDTDLQEFRDDLLEYVLFVGRDSDEAVEIANDVLPLLNDWKDFESVAWWLPRYFYLCGLSYELSGDMQKAVEIYWQLWHDFPESDYALLARYKLQPATPQ